MKIALSPQQYFSLDGKPLVAGRLQIHLHDSHNLATVYTLDAGVYTIADNPVYLDDAGEVHDTRWVDDGIYDVDVEQRLPDGTYQKISEFQFGFKMPEVKNDTLVDGIAGLKDANTELGVVSVYGYDSTCVAPMRNYIWDPNCTLYPDDGVIVESNSSEDGRWCLLWDDEKLPCTVYGITPGHESNLNAFLTYPEVISQWNIATPPIIRFLKGTYTANAVFSTSKPMYCDAGVRFANATFWTPSLEVASDSDLNIYVGDFRFTDSRAVAHSSWFRSVAAFWGCQARHLVCDPANWFANNVISQPVSVTDAVIEGVGEVVMTFQGGARLSIVNCAINARSIFNPSNAVITLQGMRWSDLWWTTTDSSYFNFGSGASIEFDPTYNSWNIDDFGTADTYAKLLTAYNVPTLDLCGRSINRINNMGFTVIRNGNIGTLYSTNSVALSNCTIDSLTVTSGDLTLVNCSANIYGVADSISATNSYITCIPSIDSNTTTIGVTGGSWNGRVNPVDYDDLSKGKAIVFRNCHVTAPSGDVTSGPSRIAGSLIDIEDCVVSTLITVYPLMVTASEVTKYYMNFNFARNKVVDTAYIYITYSGSVEYQAHPEVHDVEIVRLRIVDNQFLQSDIKGIYMPFYSADRWYRFMRGLGNGTYRNSFSYQYWGNTGNCPLACPPTMAGSNSTSGPTFTYGLHNYAIGTSPLNHRVFCLPANYSDGGPGTSDHHTVGTYGMPCACANTITFATSLTLADTWEDTDMHSMRQPYWGFLLPAVCLDPDTLPDDAFTVYYAMYDMGRHYTLTSFVTPTLIDVAEAPHNT